MSRMAVGTPLSSKNRAMSHLSMQQERKTMNIKRLSKEEEERARDNSE